MKKILYIIALSALLPLASCTQDADVDVAVGAYSEQVLFSAQYPSVASRVSGTSWDDGDAIGIYAFKSEGSELTAANVSYTTTGGSPADFTPTIVDVAIYYPQDQSELVFEAFYPYSESWGEDYMTFDITTQNSGAYGDADLMSATSSGAVGDVQILSFEHLMSKVVINITNFDGNFPSAYETLDDLQVTLSSVLTQYDLLASSNEEQFTTTDSITMTVEVDEDGQGATATALLLPTQTDTKVIFTIGGETLEAAITVESLEQGMQHTYNAYIGEPEVFVTFSSESITAWDQQEASTPTVAMELVDGVYQIYSAVGLAAFKSLVDGGEVEIAGKLMNDIDLNGSDQNPWSPIASNLLFTGSFDGGGFEISGLYLDGENTVENQALFSYTKDATFKNLSVTGQIIGGDDNSAAIVAVAQNSQFTNCYANVDGVAGALVGDSHDATTFVNCSAKGQTTGGGGFIASSDGAVSFVSCCWIGGDVTSLFGVSSTTAPSVVSCYYLSSGVVYTEQGVELPFGATDENFLVILNNGAASAEGACAWELDSDNELTLNFDVEPTEQALPALFEGLGSEESPMLIASLDNIKYLHYQMILDDQDYQGEYFTLQSDIDMQGSEQSNSITIGRLYDSASDSYITKAFGGIFDGDGKTISGIYQNSGETSALFGSLSSSTIKNLVVSGYITSDSEAAGSAFAGIAATAQNSTFISCHNLVEIDVTAPNVGGIVGDSEQNIIVNSINGASLVGSSYVGGIVGNGSALDSIIYCVNVGAVSGENYVGAIVGDQEASLSMCSYLDSSASGAVNSTEVDDAVAYTQSEMQSDEFAQTLNVNAGICNLSYSYNLCGWAAVETDYPVLDFGQEPAFLGYNINNGVYEIYTAEGLKAFAAIINDDIDRTINGKLMNDIELNGSQENQWEPIGFGSSDITYPYKGVFDGNGFEVSGLYISDAVESSFKGLFGCMSGATIKNLGVSGSIVDCYKSGGLVGVVYAGSTISSCYSQVDIEGSSYIGGLVGFVYSTSIVANCYSTGVVTSNYYNYSGSCIGYAQSDATIENCFYDSTDNSLYNIGSSSSSYTDSITALSTQYMQSEEFVELLNNCVYSYNFNSPALEATAWAAVSGSYPVLDLDYEPTLEAGYYLDAAGTYQIYTAEGLKAFADVVNNGEVAINGKLCQDITLSGSWTPIGSGETTATAYGGVFDGAGYSITGLSVVGSSACQALFGSVYYGTIQNLSVGGTVSYSASYQHSGLVAGLSIYATFTSCTTLAGSSVKAYGNNAAGISGYGYGCTFTDCHNNADISGTKYVSGILGYCSDAAATTITSCSNTGTIYSSGLFAGGIVGKIFGTTTAVTTITSCGNSGQVSGSQYIGGLAGACTGAAIYNSYNLGAVSGSSSEVGGLAGIIEEYSSQGAVMENCYTSATVSGTSNVGLAIGKCDGATITSCYYDDTQSSTLQAIGLNNDNQSIEAYTSLSELLTTLNSGTSNISGANTWVANDDYYPIFSY